METNPRRYLVRMFMFLLAVGTIAGLLAAPLEAAFMGNPALNGVILGAFSIGVLYIMRQTLRLMPERNWLLAVKVYRQAGPTGTSAGSASNGLCNAGRFAP